ncbi:MAG TPA: hypothetical protein VL463_33140 [Kofleriaceae bacterium]|jgi:hypothetical protein|nr:hypothetical protein [Kofleriaceae bacterium]
MSEHAEGQRKKHRHDLGQEDHGSVYAARTTRGIQAVLGIWIAVTFILVGWAMFDASGTHPAPPEAPAATATP